MNITVTIPASTDPPITVTVGGVSAAGIIAALGVPSYASLAAANAVLTIGTIFWNTTDEALQIATA